MSGAAAGFFEMLPSFPLAHIDEVLDIRKELEGPLTRFRGALAELTAGMEGAAHDEALLGSFATCGSRRWNRRCRRSET